MVQDFVLACYRWLLSGANVVRHLLPLTLAATVLGLALWLAFRRFDPETAATWRPAFTRLSGRAKQLLATSLALLLLCGALVQAKKVIAFRQMTVEQAPASRRNVPQLSGVDQYAPSVAVIQERTYTRTLMLPPQYVERIGTEGIQILSPYLSDPSAENVVKLVDSFKRSGQDVVFTRQLTRLDEVPVSADTAQVNIGFQHLGAASGQRHYEATFDGEYRFRNPQPQPANMRFIFPLPMGGGTMQGFYLESGGQRITEPDQHEQYSWNGLVQPGATVVVKAHYKLTGSHGFNYALGSERRRIGDFHLVASSSQSPQYGKAGIFPTRVTSHTSEWQLKDVLTAQSISLLFPRLDLQSQLLDKTLSFLPLVLVLFGLTAFWLLPGRALWGTVGLGLGLLGMAVLSAYVSPPVATLVGAGLAVVIGGVGLGRLAGWLLALMAGLLSIAFLSVEHGALVAWCLMIVAVGVLLVRKGASGLLDF